MSIRWTALPFSFADHADYARRVDAWLAEAFYERLPAAGYEVREEQIAFAFKVARAFAEHRPILAEAGSGTGKTFAYLLPAVCHARLHGKPVVIATATAALEAQLAGPAGDIAALSALLDLEIDARIAHRPSDVLCDIRLERAGGLRRRLRGQTALLRAATASRHGVRGDFPGTPDQLWAQVAWNAGCRCDACPRRGFCRLTRGREFARAAADLVVCSHDLFFADTFARDRQPPGRLPVLPPFSAVVFDEGHRAAAAAQRAAGACLRPGEVAQAIEGCEGQGGVRVRLLAAAAAARRASAAYAAELLLSTTAGDPAEPLAVVAGDGLVATGAALRVALGRLQDEMAIEQGLHEETAYALRLDTYHTWLDQARATLAAVGDPAGVLWVEDGDLWSAPRELGPLWQRHLPARTPLVFSSATLAAEGSFAYTAATLGLKDPLSARVGVPFRLARQVLCYLPEDLPPTDGEGFWAAAARRIAGLLAASGGRALILVRGPTEQRALRAVLEVPQTVLWEGDAAAEHLLAAFARDVSTSLVGWGFWEGVDIPGDALSLVIVPQLPFPAFDPIVRARRDAAVASGADPQVTVDIPAMGLRCKQGVGRLIRTSEDRGVVAILDPAWRDLDGVIDAVLPTGARRVRTLAPVRRFLDRAPAPPPARRAARSAGDR